MTSEELAKVHFNISEWPVITPTACQALAEIVDTHYIVTPCVYDLPGQLIHPLDYARRFRGTTVIAKFTFTYYQWGDKKHILCRSCPSTCFSDPVPLHTSHTPLQEIDDP